MHESLANYPIALLPRAIRKPDRPIASISIGWLTAFVPGILLAALVANLLPDASPPEFAVSGANAMFLLVLFAPVLETAIMGVVLLILLRFVSPTAAIVLSALGWAAAHSLSSPVWGLVIWWPFLIFSTLFVVWRQRSLGWAFLIPAIVHALNNLVPAVAVAYPGYFEA